MSCFNVFFTILPPMAIGIFDQFASARLLDKYPQIYMLGQKNEFFNQKRFWGWIMNAVYHSAVSFAHEFACSHIHLGSFSIHIYICMHSCFSF